MYHIVQAKFFGNLEARRALLATGSQYLVEASPHDTCWGAGMQGSWRDFARVLEQDRLPGENRLGRILMTVRGQCLKRNHPLAHLKNRTRRYRANRQMRRDPSIPAGRKEEMSTIMTHFAAQLVPGTIRLVKTRNEDTPALPTNGAVFKQAVRQLPRGIRNLRARLTLQPKRAFQSSD
jgi:hypothetical protein